MKQWFKATKQWSLAIASVASLTIGALGLQSCGGEGGPIGGGGGGGGTGGGASAAFLALLPAGQTGATNVGSDACRTCHNAGKSRDGAGEEIFSQWHETVHAAKGVGCESCHGPGSKHVAGPSKETILNGIAATSPKVCGQCHGPITAQYEASGHAHVVESAATNTASMRNGSGGVPGARCMACHNGALRTLVTEKGIDPGTTATLSDERLKAISDAAVAGTGGVVPHSASCVTCHNPHKKTGNLAWGGSEAQLRHPVDNDSIVPIDINSNSAATPITWTEYDQVCAQCHNGRGSNAKESGSGSLATSTARPSMHDSNQQNMLLGVGGSEGSGPVKRNMAHASAPGQCSHCHMPGSSHTFTVSYDKSCQPCHTTADAAARANATKSEVIEKLYALLQRLRAWSTTTFGDPIKWDYTALLPTGVTADQSKVPMALRRARHNYYFIVRDMSMGIHNKPYVDHLLLVADSNLDTLGVARGVETGRGVRLNDKYAEIMKTLQNARRAEREALD